MATSLGDLGQGLGVAGTSPLVAEPLLHLLFLHVAGLGDAVYDVGRRVRMLGVHVVPFFHQSDGLPGEEGARQRAGRGSQWLTLVACSLAGGGVQSPQARLNAVHDQVKLAVVVTVDGLVVGDLAVSKIP